MNGTTKKEPSYEDFCKEANEKVVPIVRKIIAVYDRVKSAYLAENTLQDSDELESRLKRELEDKFGTIYDADLFATKIKMPSGITVFLEFDISNDVKIYVDDERFLNKRYTINLDKAKELNLRFTEPVTMLHGLIKRTRERYTTIPVSLR